MRVPKGGKGKAKKKKAKQGNGSTSMDLSGPAAEVWHPGLNTLAEGEELEYDPTAYDCLHPFQLDWPCLSFDMIKDDLGAPRSTFPHTLFLAAGTQAASAKQNYVAFVRLADLGQGRHGKKAQKEEEDSGSDMSEDEDEDERDEGQEAPPKMHYRLIQHTGGVNRVRCMSQRPGICAVWGDTGQVKVYDATGLLAELAQEREPREKARSRLQMNPLHQHTHSMEGYAMDWSCLKEGRLATGDCRHKIHVWEPQEGGRWQVSGAYQGHEGSVEELQWSPTEETVFASSSADATIRVWDTRERSKPMITVKAHDTDVNVISWNQHVSYMMASGADDGTLRIWDLRSFSEGSFVSHFTYHRKAITSVEWSPYEGSMLATCGMDNQLAVWDLALERDPEEEAALAPEDNAQAPEDLPAQLLFVHAGQRNLKELHWHRQIPGMIVSTAEDGMNVFKPSNI